MKKRKILLGVMMLVVSTALCACGGGKNAESTDTVNSSETTEANIDSENGTSGEPTQGGSVVVGMTQDLVSLDPHQVTDAGTRGVVFNLFEGLVKPTAEGDIEAAVASAYDISQDAKTYTFTLRDNVKFHDGSTVTADDVKYSIQRYAEIQGESSAFSNVEAVTVVDEHTVTITLREGYSEFLTDVASAAIIPENNENPSKNPIGTGPFKYASYTPGQNLVIEKFEDYWKEGYPYLDQAEFQFIANMDTAYAQLQSGHVDILNYLTMDQVNSLPEQYNVVQGSMMLVHGMFLNNEYEPLQNLKVRQAISYAVDSQTINEFLFGGKSQLIGSHMIPALTKYYEEGLEDMYAYSPEKAKTLLEEAGYGQGFDLEITVPSSYSQHVDTAQIIAEQLNAVGINTTIKQVEWSTWLSDVYTNTEYQATVIGFDGTLAPSDWLHKYTSDADNNIANFKNQEYDDAFNLAYETVDDTEKAEYYKLCQKILAENAASVYIEDPVDFVAVNSKLAGYKFYPIAAQDLSTVYYVEQ